MSDRIYKSIAKPDTFIGRYMQMFAHTESALAYDFWTAVWLLSLACGRDAYVDRPHAPVFMNSYIVLVANSGITRKSTSVNAAVSFAKEALSDDPRPLFIEGRTTPEQLAQLMAERSTECGSIHCVLGISELVTLLSQDRYMRNMPALLTDLYDSPAHRSLGGTVHRGRVDVSNVCLNLLGASTPEWLLKTVNPTVVEGGFTSRCWFVVSHTRKQRVAWPEARTTGEDRAVCLGLWRDCRRLANKIKAVSITPAALAAFKRWYDKRKDAADPFLASFDSREDAHVLRVAGLLSINSGQGIIQAHDIALSIKLIQAVKQGAAGVFSMHSDTEKWAHAIRTVAGILQRAGNMPTSITQLHLATRRQLTKLELRAMLDAMHEAGYVRRIEPLIVTRGRPPEQYIGTDLLKDKRMLTVLLPVLAV